MVLLFSYYFYVDDMSIVAMGMSEVNKLKTLLRREFNMK